MRRWGIIGLVLVSIVVAWSGPAYAIDYGGIGIRPANPDPNNSRTQSIFVHTISPGQTETDTVMVVNNTKDTKTIMIYPADGIASNDGGFACAQLLDPQTDVGTWIKLDKSEVTLAPASHQNVNFTITPPVNAPVGENNGCIVAQEKKPDTSTDGQSGVQLSLRTGIRVALTVPGDLRKGLSIAGFTVERQDDKKINLHPSVKNTGNVSLDTDVKVVTRYWDGWAFAKSGGTYPVLAGKTSDYNLALPDSFWGGLMFSHLSASYDPNVDTELGKASTNKQKVVSGPTRVFWLAPKTWAWVFDALILLALAGLLWLLWLLKRQRDWMKSDWVEYKVREGDNIVELGKRFEVNWKLIAVRNRIKAPYILSADAVLFVPNLSPAPVVKTNKKGAEPKDLIKVLADKGDTLTDIADYAGITVAELARLNKIKSVRGYKISAGQEFIIPNPDK